MKAKIIVYPLLSICISFSACQKEETSFLETPHHADNSKSKSLNNKTNNMSYKRFDCLVDLPDGVYGPKELGTKCEVASFASCNKFQECKSVNEQVVNSNFSPTEIQAWRAGELVFENTDEFINDHYNFFLYLHEEEDGMHPDDIISENDLN